MTDVFDKSGPKTGSKLDQKWASTGYKLVLNCDSIRLEVGYNWTKAGLKLNKRWIKLVKKMTDSGLNLN